MRGLSKKRLLMGEKAWADYQQRRKLQKAITWQKANPVKYLFYKRTVKQKLVEYKGGKCEICGYARSVAALEFHHTNPSKKDFHIAGKSYSFERAKHEVDKCRLLCSNCHAEEHDKQYMTQKQKSLAKLVG